MPLRIVGRAISALPLVEGCRLMDYEYEIAIIGGGPAGLSAALVLGRCCRRVLLCDGGNPRNERSRGVHGFLSRDGVSPATLRRLSRKQLQRYSSVVVREVTVSGAQRVDDGFSLEFRDNTRTRVRKLLLATGIVDELPRIPGIRALWGRGVFPCPYCDAFEYRGGCLGVLGRGSDALALCRSLTAWTDNVTLFSNGPSELAFDQEQSLYDNGVRIISVPIDVVEGRRQLEYIRLGEKKMRCDALFVSSSQRQKSALIESFGCHIGASGCVETGEHESTNVPGLYVAGDASSNVQFAIVAAAEGAEAAFAINRTLVREDFDRSEWGRQ